MRTFVAVPLPEQSLDILREMQAPLKRVGADVRWAAIPSIHLTLKFLGEIVQSLVPVLAEKIGAVSRNHRRFELVLQGLGVFPERGTPRVVWCGVSGDVGSLTGLQEDIEAVCADLGFPREKRAFRPHLTLGRVRGKKNLHRISECVRIGTSLQSRFEARQVHLLRSTLTPHGALYDVLEEMTLSG